MRCHGYDGHDEVTTAHQALEMSQTELTLADTEARPGEGVRVFPLARVLTALVVCVMAVAGLETQPGAQTAFAPLTTVTAAVTDTLVYLTGMMAERTGSILLHPDGFGMHVVVGCTGLIEFVFIAVVLAVLPVSDPALRRRRWQYVLTGCVLALVINQLRLLVLWWVGTEHRLWFDAVHLGVWHPLVIVWTSFFILLCIERLSGSVPVTADKNMQQQHAGAGAGAGSVQVAADSRK